MVMKTVEVAVVVDLQHVKEENKQLLQKHYQLELHLFKTNWGRLR